MPDLGRSAELRVSATFLKVANLSDLAEGGRLSVEVEGRAVLVFRLGGDVFAVEDVCTHDGQPRGHSHALIAAAVALSQVPAWRNPRSANPAPPGWPS